MGEVDADRSERGSPAHAQARTLREWIVEAVDGVADIKKRCDTPVAEQVSFQLDAANDEMSSSDDFSVTVLRTQ
jgi:hypothetical protein